MEEFGTITGKVIEITEIPLPDEEKQFQYNVTVALKEPLITNNGKKIPFQQNSVAQAQIITNKRRLLHRIIDQFIVRLKNT